MYLAIVQLVFLVVVAFAVSRVMKLKSKVNRNGSTFLKKYLACESILELLTPSFVGSYGIWFPEFFLLRNCFSFVWNGGRVLITFDPTTALLDLFSQGSDAATKSIQDDSRKEVLLAKILFDKVKSRSQSCLNFFKKMISYKSASDESPIFQSKISEEKCPVPEVAETVYKSTKETADDAKKVVIKVVLAAESKWTVYRFRVAKEFNFSELKNVVEERWANEKAKIGSQWKLKYQDDENEWITIQNQLEWEEAMRVGKDLVRLHVAA